MHGLRGSVAAAVLAVAAGLGMAADIKWNNAAGGSFTDGGNWVGGQAPGLPDNAVFNLTSPVPYEVTLTGAVTNSKMLVQRDDLILNLAGGAYFLTNEFSIGVFTSGMSHVTITGGLFRMVGANKNLFAGYSAGGTLTVAGSNTVLDMEGANYLYSGFLGTGLIEIVDGAVVRNVQYLGVGRNNTNGPGTLLIDNATLTNVWGGGPIGEVSQGIVIVTNGGLFHIGNTTWTVQGFGSKLVVTDPGSRMVSGNYVMIGTKPGGTTIVVANGGFFAPPHMYLGYGDGPATWADMVVANTGSEVRVTGNLMMSGHTTLGKGGRSTLAITDGALLSMGQGYCWSNSTLTLDNGRLYGNNGTLRLYRGSRLEGAGFIERAHTINHGTVAPGHPGGSLVVTNANFTQFANGVTNGTLAFTLGGTNAGDYGRLAVHGILTLAGTCSVSLASGYVPRNGDAFDLLDWTTLSGTFGTLDLPALGRGFWVTDDLYTSGRLSVIVPASGAVVLVR